MEIKEVGDELHYIIEYNEIPPYIRRTEQHATKYPGKVYLIQKPKPGFLTWLLCRKPTKILLGIV